MQRRTFVRALAAAGVAGTTVAGGAGAEAGWPVAEGGRGSIETLTFDSTASLLGADGSTGVADGLVAVRSEPQAYNVDEDGNGDAVEYPDDAAMPLVCVDSPVAGVGCPFATDDAPFSKGNEEFLLNVWDELGDGEGGTVLWDEGHDQYYTLDQFATFEGYAEENGYDVETTTDLSADAADADGVVVTSPTGEFSDGELSALADHVDGGGWLALHDQSDYRDFDETGNLNAVADHLDLGFRFNDDQVLDQANNDGAPFVPTTTNFDEQAFGALFERRPGLGGGYDRAKTYAGTVRSVADGDTFDVELENGRVETVRVLGVDTPELPENADAELPEEWEGISDLDYLGQRGTAASEWAKAELSDADVTISFDEMEALRDPFNRLLAYVDYDAGSYNRRLVEAGHARVFDSSLTRHDELWRVEREAREAGRGLWAESDPSASSEIRNGDYEELYFPRPAAVQVAGGEAVADSQVVVAAEDSADSAGAPLVAVDETARLAVAGAPMVDERYEAELGFAVDTSGYGNFAFLTSLADALSAMADGEILVEGGHGQFGAGYALSAEDMAFYQRYLEGVDIGLEQVNDVVSADLAARGRALIITTPATGFTRDELEAIRAFNDEGGAVVLLGSAVAPEAATVRLNGLANLVGSDLRVSLSAVTDDGANLNGNDELLTTGAFGDRFTVFGSFEGGTRLTPTPTPTSAPATEEDPGTAPPTETTGPGLGTLAGVAGALGAAGLLSRLRGGDEEGT
jgi:endonuclease YncB( thermonuclease family)